MNNFENKLFRTDKIVLKEIFYNFYYFYNVHDLKCIMLRLNYKLWHIAVVGLSNSSVKSLIFLN